jgi:arylsulfatase A-like enzyme
VRALGSLLILSAAVTAHAAAPAIASLEPPPNVLVIVTDDQRAGTLGVMPRTRHWFADRGVRYPNAFATTPLCCPSRASILTGQYAHNHGVLTNADTGQLDLSSTVQHHLRQEGYLTGLAGKFLNEWPVESDAPDLDRWAVYSPPGSTGGYSPSRFNVNGDLRTVERYSTDYLAARAAGFLRWFEARDDRPWFLYVAPFAPHLPATPAARHADAPVPRWNPGPAVGEPDRSDKPPSIRAKGFTADVEEVRARQLRTLMSVDELVGTVRDTLRALGEERDTLAIFMSDNGFLWGEHRLMAKRVPYGLSIRIPLVARWPGHLAPGTVDPRLAANIDLTPTILEAAGIPLPADLDGRSLLEPGERQHLFLEYAFDTGSDVLSWQSVWTGTVQYTEWDEMGGTFREYYDLDTDPWQLGNRLHDGNQENDPPPGTLDQLAGLVEAGASCAGTEGPGACP